MSRAPYSPSTEPPAHREQRASASTFNKVLRKRRAACINRRQRAFFCLSGKLRPSIPPQSGTQFPPEPLWESVSRFGRRFWDAVPQRGLFGKQHPRIQPNNGTQFPVGPSTESSFRFEPSNWGAVSHRDPKLIRDCPSNEQSSPEGGHVEPCCPNRNTAV